MKDSYPTWVKDGPIWVSREGQLHTLLHPITRELWWPDFCVFHAKGVGWCVKHRTSSGHDGVFVTPTEARQSAENEWN